MIKRIGVDYVASRAPLFPGRVAPGNSGARWRAVRRGRTAAYPAAVVTAGTGGMTVAPATTWNP
jgi:hypothetical protein